MKKALFIAPIIALLAACGTSDPYSRCDQSSNPMECRSWADAGGSIDDYLIGGMIGYTWANMNGQRVIVVDRDYHGPSRRLRRQIASQDAQIQRLQRKVAAQKSELRRQQASRASTSSSKPVAAKKSFFSSKPSTSRSSSSRPTFTSSRRSGK